MDELLQLTSKAESSHFWFRGFRRFIRPLLERAAARRTDLAILDCGCGTGYNLRQLAAYGRVVGIDLNAAGLALARGERRPLARADAARLPFRDRCFDLVTSFDVLQCVPEDQMAVREIARVLKPGGAFVGNVAALDMLRGDHSLLSEEVRRYTKPQVERLLRGGGFEPIVIRYTFASLFPMMLASRGVQRLRGARACGNEIAVPPAAINGVLTAVVTTEAAAARWISMPFGTSLTFLAIT